MMKLAEYEKTALKFYTQNNEEKYIVTYKNFDSEKETMKISSELGNPYRLMH
jgi:uncharacterized protein YjhX (UPF0386 family)